MLIFALALQNYFIYLHCYLSKRAWWNW